MLLILILISCTQQPVKQSLVTTTPTAISNNTPAPSSTTSSSNGQPFADAPLCPTHNDIAWHGLWDAERGCHYDHTHNDDPALGDSVFGPAGTLWGGQNISYPWLTPNENNEHGHSGYKYYVNLAPFPASAQEGYEYIDPDPNFVTAFRIQYHDVGGNAHMVKRFHSYFMEVQITSRDGSVTGTISTGGHADFGCLHVPYKDEFLLLPDFDPMNSSGQSMCGIDQTLDADPYRAASSLTDLPAPDSDSDNMWIWTSHDRYGYNLLGYFFFRTLDSLTGMDRQDPYAEHFICPDFTCKFNNSEHHVFNVFMMIPSSLDTDGDGIVNYVGYTDIKGNIVQGCTASDANCVPLQIVNAPVGTAIWSRNTSGLRPEGDPIRDHDIYFNGQPSGWIVFPH